MPSERALGPERQPKSPPPSALQPRHSHHSLGLSSLSRPSTRPRLGFLLTVGVNPIPEPHHHTFVTPKRLQDSSSHHLLPDARSFVPLRASFVSTNKTSRLSQYGDSLRTFLFVPLRRSRFGVLRLFVIPRSWVIHNPPRNTVHIIENNNVSASSAGNTFRRPCKTG